jgi:hypothetical protein
VPAWIEALQMGVGRLEREALLFTLRDLVVLIVVVAVLLWLLFAIRRR